MSIRVHWSTIASTLAAIAQLVEHFIRNEKVRGSNPRGGSLFFCLPALSSMLRLVAAVIAQA